MKNHIPNALTLLNVLSGSIAVVFAVRNEWEVTAGFVLAGLIFDFLDGFSARALKVQSKLGLQLDSLADVITFGLVPGIVLYQLIGMSLGANSEINTSEAGAALTLSDMLPFVGFAVTLSSALRLGRFNIDEKQVSSFIGLPTPANALLIVSLPMILLFNGSDALNRIILEPWFLLGLTALSTLLLNAPIPLFALKFKSWDFKSNALRYLFLGVSLICIGTMKFLSVPVIILIYILSSLLFYRKESTAQGT